MQVTVIGAGIMGNGIAQISASAGHDVVLHDIDGARIQRALETIDGSLARMVKAERLSEGDAKASRARIAASTSMTDAVRKAEIVIEAVPEIIELKHEVLKAAAAGAPGDALLATNTSQLSITRIGSVLGDAAQRLVGMHFFNPPVMMRLVELIRGQATTDGVLQRARSFSEGLGKTVVVCKKDSPGFITSRAIVALRLECMRILEEGIASAEDIDTAMKLGFNFPMGPLELGDFNGHDTGLHAALSLLEAHGERFRPTVTYRNLVAAGKLGRKTGEGFYKYDDKGKRID